MTTRLVSLLSLLVVSSACRVTVPRPPPGVTISIRANVHAQGRVEVPTAPVVPVAPPAPPAPVALVGAPVVEFFGIPLEGAQDVLFVLDCSGSMEDPALGQLAALATPPPPPPPVEAPPVIVPAPGLPPPIIPGEPPPPPPATPPVEVAPAPVTTAPPPPAAAPAGPRKIDVARVELIDALRRLPAGTRMNLIFFNSGLDAVAPTLFTLDDGGRPGLVAFVMDRDPTGSTALAPAMRAAFLMNARRIVLLSDGLGNVGGSADRLLRDAREAVRGGVRIDTIGLGADQDVGLLHQLAADSGGLYQRL